MKETSHLTFSLHLFLCTCKGRCCIYAWEIDHLPPPHWVILCNNSLCCCKNVGVRLFRFSFWVNSCFILIVCVSRGVLPGFLPLWLLNLCEWERTFIHLVSIKASKTNAKKSWKPSVHIKNCTLTTHWLKYKANAISYFLISLSPANRAALDSTYRLSKDCLIDPSAWCSFATFLQLFHLTLSASASAFAAGNGRYLQGFFSL